MKLYVGGRAPNPRRVKVFLAEKGIDVPMEDLDMGALAHRGPAYSKINPLQRVPALELDDGSVLTESIAICRYFEALHPTPPLFGQGAREQAVVEMWERRAEFHLLSPVSNVFRHTHPAMKEMEKPQVPEYGEASKPRVTQYLQFLDGELAKRKFVAGGNYTVADITTMIAIDFMKPVKLAVPDELTNVKRWHAEVSARPSAKA